MAKQRVNKREIKLDKARKKEVRSFEVKKLFAFLDGFSESSKKYNSLDIKVDSNLVKQK